MNLSVSCQDFCIDRFCLDNVLNDIYCEWNRDHWEGFAFMDGYNVTCQDFCMNHTCQQHTNFFSTCELSNGGYRGEAYINYTRVNCSDYCMSNWCYNGSSGGNNTHPNNCKWGRQRVGGLRQREWPGDPLSPLLPRPLLRQERQP